MSKYTEIRMDFSDEEAKEKIVTITSSDIQPFAITDEVKSTTFIAKDYPTLEKNFWVLDGNKNLLSYDENTEEWDNEGIGLCFLPMSDEDGNFIDYPEVYFSFGEDEDSLVTSYGIMLTFSEYDYSNNIVVTLYNTINGFADGDTLEFEYHPDSTNYYCEFDDGVHSYNAIKIQFLSTNNPYRYIKLTQLDIGYIIKFSEENVISCNIVEEIDTLSNELSINTAEFEIYSDDDGFNILNPQGIYGDLHAQLPVEIYLVDGTDREFMGKFYLKEWEDSGNNIGTFKAEDYISILENYEVEKDITYHLEVGVWRYDYAGSYFYTSNELVEKILNQLEISDTKYVLNYTDTNYVQGMFGGDNLRNTLQQILFVSQTILDCSRSKKLQFKKLSSETILKEFTEENIFIDSLSIKKETEYNQFNIYSYDYDFNYVSDVPIVYSTDDSDLIGTDINITFDSPKAFAVNTQYHEDGHKTYHLATINDDLITEENPINLWTPFHINFTLTDLNSFEDWGFLSGIECESNKKLFTYTYTTSNDIENNTLTIENCELIVPENFADSSDISAYTENLIRTSDVATFLKEHYENLFTVEFEYEFDGECVGDYVSVDVGYDKIIVGHIISLDIDLVTELATCKIEGKIEENG